MNTRSVLGELRELRRSARDLEQGCDRLIERIETEPQGPHAGMIDQHQSEMSVRRHCAAVRRLISQGKPGAYIDGRRHLLTPEAHVEELGSSSRPLAKATPRRPAGAGPCSADNDTGADGSDGVEREVDEVQAMRDRIARRLGRLT